MTAETAASTSAAERTRHESAAPTAIILLYHRVADPPSDPQLLSVSPAHFAAHLEVLRGWRWTVPLADVATLAELPPAAIPRVVITFDDGYADNLETARPLLERNAVPATFFVVSGDAGRVREFWWDELERVLLYPGELPARLRLTIADGQYEWSLGAAARYRDTDFACFRAWNVLSPPPTPRHKLYRDLHRLLRPLPAPQRNAVLDELWRVQQADPVMRPTHRAMTPAEITTLARSELIEIGAHTATHPVLAGLPHDVLATEINASKQHLEQLLGRRVHSFSYPFGGRGDYTPATVAAVRAAGFRQACANFAGPVTRISDQLQLPRHLVRDWDAATFCSHLQEWVP